MKLIENNLKHIIHLCKKYGVRNLYAFGSILTNDFNEKSDIDLLVNFNSAEIKDPFINFFDLIYELQDLLGRKVDLVDETAITNDSFRDMVYRTRQLIYG